MAFKAAIARNRVGEVGNSPPQPRSRRRSLPRSSVAVSIWDRQNPSVEASIPTPPLHLISEAASTRTHMVASVHIRIQKLTDLPKAPRSTSQRQQPLSLA